MSRRLSHLVPELLAALAGTVLVLGIAQPDSRASLLAGIAALAVAAIVSSRYVTLGSHSRVLTVGSRSLRHRESYSSTPEPAHPDTAGRTRSRAPAQPLAAA